MKKEVAGTWEAPTTEQITQSLYLITSGVRQLWNHQTHRHRKTDSQFCYSEPSICTKYSRFNHKTRSVPVTTLIAMLLSCTSETPCASNTFLEIGHLDNLRSVDRRVVEEQHFHFSAIVGIDHSSSCINKVLARETRPGCNASVSAFWTCYGYVC
jgi:hypothetical protein